MLLFLNIIGNKFAIIKKKRTFATSKVEYRKPILLFKLLIDSIYNEKTLVYNSRCFLCFGV